MNLPSTIGTNWRWRMKQGEFNAEKIAWLREMAEIYDRLPKKQTKQEGSNKEEKVSC